MGKANQKQENKKSSMLMYVVIQREPIRRQRFFVRWKEKKQSRKMDTQNKGHHNMQQPRIKFHTNWIIEYVLNAGMHIFAFFISHQQVNSVEGRACGQQFVDEHCESEERDGWEETN